MRNEWKSPPNYKRILLWTSFFSDPSFRLRNVELIIILIFKIFSSSIREEVLNIDSVIYLEMAGTQLKTFPNWAAQSSDVSSRVTGVFNPKTRDLEKKG